MATTCDWMGSRLETKVVMATRARFRGDKVLHLCDEILPDLASDEVRVSVEVAALCGSDIRPYFNGSVVVPGHEVAGAIIEAGDGVTASIIGARGIVYMPVFCNRCESCASGFTNGCLKFSELIGWQRDGGYSTIIDIPLRCFIPVPETMPLDIAVLGLDTVGTAAHALRWALRTQTNGFERIAVIGCGPLGIGVSAVAQEMGLPSPHVYDPHGGRLDAALSLGAHRMQNLGRESQFDLVVEASGAQRARELAQQISKPGAVLVALGESEEPYVIPATPRSRRTNLFTLRTFYFPLSEVTSNWKLLESVGPRLVDTIVEPSNLDDISSTFRRFANGELIKPVIHFL